MVKKLVGVYDTEAEVMEVVGRLEEAGYLPQDITLVAKNDADSLWLRNEGVNTTTANDLSRSERADDESFWEKVKSAFTVEANDDYGNESFTSRFHKFGFSEDESEKYNRAVQRGKIVVLAPESYSGSLNATTGVEGTHYDMDNRPAMDHDYIPNQEKEKSAFAREYDVAFLKEDEAEDGRERRAKRKWDIDNNKDRL